jgi:hypothetical protein
MGTCRTTVVPPSENKCCLLGCCLLLQVLKSNMMQAYRLHLRKAATVLPELADQPALRINVSALSLPNAPSAVPTLTHDNFGNSRGRSSSNNAQLSSGAAQSPGSTAEHNIGIEASQRHIETSADNNLTVSVTGLTVASRQKSPTSAHRSTEVLKKEGAQSQRHAETASGRLPAAANCGIRVPGIQPPVEGVLEGDDEPGDGSHVATADESESQVDLVQTEAATSAAYSSTLLLPDELHDIADALQRGSRHPYDLLKGLAWNQTYPESTPGRAAAQGWHSSGRQGVASKHINGQQAGGGEPGLAVKIAMDERKPWKFTSAVSGIEGWSCDEPSDVPLGMGMAPTKMSFSDLTASPFMPESRIGSKGAKQAISWQPP